MKCELIIVADSTVGGGMGYVKNITYQDYAGRSIKFATSDTDMTNARDLSEQRAEPRCS